MQFVRSQYDIIFTFANQRFGEVCWHKLDIILHALSLLVFVQCVTVMNYRVLRGLRVPAFARWLWEPTEICVGVRGGCGLNLVRGGRGIKFDFEPVTECWLNACESDTIKKKVSLSYFTDLDFLSFWNESLNKLPLAMKHVAWVFSGFPWQVQIWEGLRGGCRLEVYGCGSGQDFLNSCGCGAALKFASAGRERTKNFNPRRTL